MDECRNFVARLVPETASHFVLMSEINEPVLLAHFNGSDGSTVFTDTTGRHTLSGSGNAQISTAQNAFSLGTGSLLLDGTGDFVRCDNVSDFIFGTNDMTVDVWIRLAAIGINQRVYTSGNSAGAAAAYPSIVVQGGNLLAVDWQGVSQIQGTTALSANTWYHVALTRANLQLKLFLNGAQEGSTYTGSDFFTVEASFDPVIGANQVLGGLFFNGFMNELRVINGTAAWTSPFTPPSAPYTLP